FVGRRTFLYDDSGEEDIPLSQASDGPGSLRDFEGEPAYGIWQFQMIDNSPNHIGTNNTLIGYIEPDDETNDMGAIVFTIQPFKWRYRTCNVPPGVTNLIAWLRQGNPLLPLDLYLRRDVRPDVVNYDKFATINPPGSELTLGLNDSPSLRPGKYYVGISNP